MISLITAMDLIHPHILAPFTARIHSSQLSFWLWCSGCACGVCLCVDGLGFVMGLCDKGGSGRLRNKGKAKRS